MTIKAETGLLQSYAYLLAFIVFRDFCPQPHQPVLVILVYPEPSYMRAMVRVPAAILTSGCGMHVKNGVDTVLGTRGNGAIEMFEAFRLEHAGIHVVFEVAVADCDADAIETKRFEERGIWFSEEVFEELSRCQS